METVLHAVKKPVLEADKNHTCAKCRESFKSTNGPSHGPGTPSLPRASAFWKHCCPPANQERPHCPGVCECPHPWVSPELGSLPRFQSLCLAQLELLEYFHVKSKFSVTSRTVVPCYMLCQTEVTRVRNSQGLLLPTRGPAPAGAWQPQAGWQAGSLWNPP